MPACRYVAGLALLAALALPGPAAALDGVDAEIGCLALTIYHEARGEPEQGKLAVGYVVMNRTRSDAFPDGVCDVVQQGGEERHRCQFSWWCDGRSDRPRDRAALQQSLSLAQAIYRGCAVDPTQGALWFHATRVRPAWAAAAGAATRIGRHVFYRGEAGIATAAAHVGWDSNAARIGCAAHSSESSDS